MKLDVRGGLGGLWATLEAQALGNCRRTKNGVLGLRLYEGVTIVELTGRAQPVSWFHLLE
jgi:hypothetical protein